MRRADSFYQGVLAVPVTAAAVLRERLSTRTGVVAVSLPVLLVLAATLRFTGLGNESLWNDEISTAVTIRLSWIALLTQPIVHHQPLDFLIIKAWTEMTGTSEAMLRFPAAVYGTLTVAATYLVGRRLWNDWIGLGAALLVAVAPGMVWFSQEARPYSLQTLLLLASLYFLVGYIDTRKRRSLIAYGIVATLGLYTHLYFVFFILASAAAAGLWLLVQRRFAELWAVFLAHVCIGLALLPRVPVLLAYSRDVGTVFAQPPRDVLQGATMTVGMAFIRSSIVSPLVVAVIWLMIGVSVGTAAIPASRRRMLLPAIVCVTSAGLLFAANLVVDLPIVWRYLVPATPLWFLLAAHGFASLLSWRPVARPVLVVPIAIMAALGAAAWGWTASSQLEAAETKQDWRGMARFVEARSVPTDILVFDPPRYRENFTYYFKQPAEILPAHRIPAQWPCEQGQRVWLIGDRGRSQMIERVAALGRSCSLAFAQDFPTSHTVLLFTPTGADAPSLASQVDCKARRLPRDTIHRALCGTDSAASGSR